MQIRQTSNRNMLLSGLVIASLITLTLMHDIISTNLYEGEQRRSVLVKVADQLRVNSSERTRTLRYYAATSSSVDMNPYKSLVTAQESALTALLKNYDDGTVKLASNVGVTAISQLIESGGATRDEKDTILRGQKFSNDLIRTEASILEALLADNAFAANQLLNSEQYSVAKYGFLQSIEELVTVVNISTDSEAEKLELKKAQLFRNYGFLLFIILAATLIEYLWGTKKIIAPIEELTQIASNMASGNYKSRAHIDAKNEIGVLATTFNEMAESIEEDISERKRTTYELQTLRQEAEAANSAKSDFLATMSHGIRTPMNAIIGMSHLALQSDLNSKQHDYVIKIFNAANSLLGIINDILDFSKMEAGKTELEEIAFRLDEVLENLSTVISIKVREKNLEFLISVGTDVPLGLMGDSLRLGQILINLANNAVKFSDAGEIIVRVEKLEENDGRVKLKFSVQDSGIGMTPEQVKGLFRAFSQADTSTTRKYGGTGLGLTISKRLTEMMNGEIWVESEHGTGSTFLFTAEFKVHDVAQGAALSLPEALIGNRVLVVDDSPDSRMIFHDMLEALGLSCEEAKTGREAVERLIGAAKEDQPFNLVFTDWRMPGMDGIDTIREIQKNATISPQPKIIMVTAYGRQEIIDQAGDLGVTSILLKPVTPSILLDSVMASFGFASEPAVRRKQLSTDHAEEAIQAIRGARILLVEDNAVNQQVATELLEQAQLVISIANNGQEAIETLDTQEFDGVLMDLQMPIMGGLEATQKLRAMDKFKDLPIIAMTANVMGGDREKCLEAGMNGFVGKPIDPKMLYATLVQWIEHGERDVPEALLKRNAELSDGDGELQCLTGFDVSAALNRVGGSVAAYRRLLARFVESEKDAVARIRAALAQGEHETSIREAHTLKGVAGNIGASDVQAIAAEVEKFLNNNKGTIPEDLLLETENKLQLAIDAAVKETVTPSKLAGKDVKTATEIQPLLDRLATQIDEFDSTASETAEMLNSNSSGTTWDTEANELTRALDSYDYDRAEELLAKVQGKLNSGPTIPPLTVELSAELAEQLESLFLRVKDHDAMVEGGLDQLLEASAWLVAHPSKDMLKRSLSDYDFAEASVHVETILAAVRDHADMDDKG